jgi:hypothetical protein
MNREERRRQERANRLGSSIPKTIAPERHGAETQDFMAATIFVAGAAGIRADTNGAPLPPLFVICLDNTAFSQTPELLTLFALLKSEGSENLHAQLKGTARWGAMPGADGQMLAKLELNLTAPVKARPSFLLLADNYKDNWDIPATKGYLLGITTMEKFRALPESASYADALEACILLQPDPSKAAQMLHDHYTASKQPFAPSAPPVLFVNGDEMDDMRYQVGTTTGPDGEVLYAFMLLRPTGMTQIPMGDDSVPKAISSAYAERGLHWFREGEPLKPAEGWSWKELGREFIITDADGIMIASFEPVTIGPENSWLEEVRSSGFLVLNIGDELVMGDGISTQEQMIAAHDRGNVVTGIIHHIHAAPAPDPAPEEAPTGPVCSASEHQDPGGRPWWKRLFRP